LLPDIVVKSSPQTLDVSSISNFDQKELKKREQRKRGKPGEPKVEWGKEMRN